MEARLGIPWVELDGLWHLPNWEQRPQDEFQAILREKLSADAWIVDGFYRDSWPIIWERADTLIWLDYPLSIALWRVTKRSLWRGLLRKPLWNGNRESLWTHLFTRDSMIRFTAQTHAERRGQLEKALNQRGEKGPQVLRFRHPRETQQWLQSLADR